MDENTIVAAILRDRVRLLAYIRSIVNDAHIAEDLLQEITMVALNSRDKIENPVHLRNWLRQTAMHRSINYLRSRRRQPIVMDQEILQVMNAEWFTPEKDSAAEKLNALQHCLKKLSPSARELVELRYTHNLSGKNVAKKLNRPANTIYVTLSRIYQSLSECIQRQLRAEERCRDE